MQDGGVMELRRGEKLRSLLHIITASLLKYSSLLASTMLSALDKVLFKEIKTKTKQTPSPFKKTQTMSGNVYVSSITEVFAHSQLNP